MPGIRQEDTVNGLAAKPFPSMRRSHVQHNTARVPRRTPFWPKPQKGAKALFPGHPAALMNEPPAPHRERQVAAKGGMLQTRSRPQSCGFRPPVLAAIAKRRCAPGVGQPTCGAPDAAEPVEQKPLPPHAAGVRKPSFPADTSGGALPALATCFGGYRQLVDNIPASAGLSSVDRP